MNQKLSNAYTGNTIVSVSVRIHYPSTLNTVSKQSTAAPFNCVSIIRNAQPFLHTHSMSSDSLFSLARSKLHLSVGGSKDNCSLHRWVLLKNSIIHSIHPSTSTAAVRPPQSPEPSAADAFIYPDLEKDVDASAASEAQWFDSLLETLGDDDDDEFLTDSGIPLPSLPDEDDEDSLLSPLPSPMSSSDDLTTFASPFAYPYPVPYPPFHPPLISPFHYDSDISPPPYHDPLPYFDEDEDVEDLPVPDAIEDTSDDESESPSTPSLGRSASLVFVDPATVPLPRHSGPHVYSDTDASFLQSFNFDAVPFPNPNHTFLDEC